MGRKFLEGLKEEEKKKQKVGTSDSLGRGWEGEQDCIIDLSQMSAPKIY
jgi:hypothetical protein